MFRDLHGIWTSGPASQFSDPLKPFDFPMKQYLGGDLRGDIHPRLSRDGRQICFDALETAGWTRQLHVAALAKGTQ